MNKGVFNRDTGDWHVNGTRVFTGIHPSSNCEGQPCIVHNPTGDYVANVEDWPYLQRASGLFERICPCGVGHPDRDGLHYLVEVLKQSHWSIHGCCGCCKGEK